MLIAFTRFVALKASLTIDTDLFAGWRPLDAVSDCSVVLGVGGPSPDHNKKRVEALFTIETRGRDYHETEARAVAIFDAVHTQAGVTFPVVGGETVWSADFIRGTKPRSTGIGEKRLHYFWTSFTVYGVSE